MYLHIHLLLNNRGLSTYRYVQLRIYITTCLQIYCDHSGSFLLLLPSPKTPLSVLVPRNEIAFIVKESCFHHVFPGSVKRDGTATYSTRFQHYIVL